jgi:hypothetical protein
MIDAPHEYGEQRVAGPEQLPLGMLHLEPLRLGLGLALHDSGRLAHGGSAREPNRPT